MSSIPHSVTLGIIIYIESLLNLLQVAYISVLVDIVTVVFHCTLGNREDHPIESLFISLHVSTVKVLPDIVTAVYH